LGALAAFFFLSAQAGCVLYSPTNLVIKVPDFYEHKAFKDGLHVIADPYIVPSKSEYLFDTDFTKKGVYAVHLILQNEGPNEFDFTESRVYLRREDGEIFRRMDREELEDKVLHNTAGRMLAFGAAGSLGFLIFSVPFALGAGLDSYLSNKVIRKDVGERFREDRSVIKPLTLMQGFLFFRVSSGREENQAAFAKHYTLRIERLKNVATEEMFDVEIPIEKGAGLASQSYLS
jgi:hypothetical protein